MNAYFKRQLADYVEYHRDPRNCAMHVIGIASLFLAAILPLTLWPIDALGGVTLATMMVLPVLIYWLALDAGIGLAIVGMAAALVATAGAIVNNASATGVWTISAVLIAVGVGSQIVGHRVFERRQPALVDNPGHLLLGPMFVTAKLFIALGFRRDLSIIIGPVRERALGGVSAFPDHPQGNSLPHS